MKNAETNKGKKERGVAEGNHHLNPDHGACWDRWNREGMVHGDQTFGRSELARYIEEIAEDRPAGSRVDCANATYARCGTVIETRAYYWSAIAKRILERQVRSCGREVEWRMLLSKEAADGMVASNWLPMNSETALS